MQLLNFSDVSNKFNLPESIAEKLSNLDFKVYGFSNKSHRAIRKMLPYLMEGNDDYSARCFAGYYHTISKTKSEIYQHKLLDSLKLLEKNSLRQPIVEKILNQMINVVNSIIAKYGKPDEIRVELARELKLSKDERNELYKNINRIEKENKNIENKLLELGLRATRNNIIKWRLYHEIFNDEQKLKAICIYCGNPISLTDAINGVEIDIEHIIPKSLIFDDSQSNKTLSHRNCNADKNNRTAYDFMKSKSEQEFNDYIERVNNLYKNKFINKAKRDKLLTPANKISNDFIARQLRETQYISRKAREILSDICYNVWTTTGSITAQLRYLWGWDSIIENLRIPFIRETNPELIETLETTDDFGNSKSITRIKNWSKRDDNRHHALDALTVACTKQSFIQRINTLNSSDTRNLMLRDIQSAVEKYDAKKGLLENYIISLKPFSTSYVQQKIANILVSFKPGKKVATWGKRKIKKNGKKIVVQNNILIPRGPLSEESVYGKIKVIEKNQPLKYLFKNPHLIFKPYIKHLVEERLNMFDNDPSLAYNSSKKDPIFLDNDKTIKLENATCYKEEIVIRKPLKDLNDNQIDDIVDPVIKQKVKDYISQFGGKAKSAFKNLETNPIWLDNNKTIPVKNVRCFTGLVSVEPLKFNENGSPISFVKPGNNHHLAIYLDELGNKQIHVCTFWHAVERKKFGFPVIINNPSIIYELLENDINDSLPNSFIEKLPNPKWTFIESFQQNEMFILGLSYDNFLDALSNNNLSLISQYLYRLQNIGTTGYKLLFRHHLASSVDNDFEKIGVSSFNNFNFIKAKINCIGELIYDKKNIDF